MKKTYTRHKFLYFDDTAKKWTTQCRANVGDDEAFDEVDFLTDQEPTEMIVTHETEKEEPPIVDFDFDPDMEFVTEVSEEHCESPVINYVYT